MKKVIAFENRSAQAEAHRQFEAGSPAINNVILEWNKLDVGGINDELMNDLLRGIDVAKAVKTGLIHSFQEEDLKIAGRKVTREKMAELMTPPDLSALQEAVAEAAVHTEAFTLGSVQNGKFALDQTKMEELKRSTTVYTDDTKILNAVTGIIDNLQPLFDSGKLHKENVARWLVKAQILDHYLGDGLQPARSLFIQN